MARRVESDKESYVNLGGGGRLDRALAWSRWFARTGVWPVVLDSTRTAPSTPIDARRISTHGEGE